MAGETVLVDLDTEVVGTLSSASEVDIYVVELSEGQRYHGAIWTDPALPEGDRFGLRYWLYDPDGDQVFADTDDFNEYYGSGVAVAPVTGTYEFRVTNTDLTVEQDYRLALQESPVQPDDIRRSIDWGTRWPESALTVAFMPGGSQLTSTARRPSVFTMRRRWSARPCAPVSMSTKK
ncbi:MAG: hypothetical protein AAFV62_00315 [Pseudomonadota bacterium]